MIAHMGGVTGVLQCQLIETEELLDRQKAGLQHGDCNAFVEPGMMWFMPWLFDHQDPDLEQYLPELRKAAENLSVRHELSINYLTGWAEIRDPVALMLPCGRVFKPDSSPAGSRGWDVLIAPPNITVHQAMLVGNVSYSLSAGLLSQRVRARD